jgi:hypothetical protein
MELTENNQRPAQARDQISRGFARWQLLEIIRYLKGKGTSNLVVNS